MKKTLLVISLVLNLGFVTYLFVNVDSESGVNSSNTWVLDEKGNQVAPVNIVMLGNSITYQGNWDQVLNRNDVFNGGKPGWTSQQLSWVIKNFIIPNKPKLCFFKAGINDLSLGIPPERILQNMTMVMDSIKKVGTNPVYTTTLYQRGETERNKVIDSINLRMKAFCESNGYDFLDLRPFLCKNGDVRKAYIQDDNTHLKPEAYPQWARAMKPILEKYGL